MDFPPQDVVPTVTRIAELLKSQHKTVAVSEAACGGLLSAYLVSVPGASKYFHGGTLVYSLRSKLKLSGWSEQDIQEYTGPSGKVVLRLARTLRMDLGANYVLSETGIAGPVVSQDEENSALYTNDDVGTVYLGISSAKGEVSKRVETHSSDRAFNMQQFAKIGLEFFLQELEKELEPAESTDAAPDTAGQPEPKKQKKQKD